MNIEAWATIVTGGLGGAIAGGFLTYFFQRKLLHHQIEAQKELARQQIAFLKDQSSLQMEASKEAQNQFHEFLEQKILVSLLTRWNTTMDYFFPAISRLQQSIARLEEGLRVKRENPLP